jgi:hypothetical protein
MDETRMMEFVGQAVADVGALLGGAMVVIGDKLGLYRAMGGHGRDRISHAGGTGCAHRHCGALRPRMAERSGGARVPVLRRGRAVLAARRVADDDIAGNLNPVGAAYYGFSTLLCTPSSLSQDIGTALGAQAGEARLRKIVTSAGFAALRRVAETPFNIVLEARA